MSRLGTMPLQFLVLIVLSSYVCASSRRRPDVNPRQQCPSDNTEPCAFRLEKSGRLHHLSWLGCRCSGTGICAEEFSDTTHDALVNITLLHGSLTLKMKFCDRIDNLRECDPSESSVRWSTGDRIYYSLDFYKCRCPGVITPLSVEASRRRLRYTFKCGDLPLCTNNQVYSIRVAEKITLQCNCVPPMGAEPLVGNMRPRCRNR